MLRNNQHGFTLLELLISMMIFSILSVMAYAGLQTIIDTRVHTESRAERLVELQTAFMFIGRDVSQAIGRPVRDGYGDQRAALEGGEFGSELLSLTRGGRTNFLKQNRSYLQRIAYRLEDDNLIRASWPMVDQDFNDDAMERVLLKNVKSVEFRYFDGDLDAKSQWPSSEEEGGLALLPRAVEIIVETEDIGKIRRVFQIATGASEI